MAWSLITSAAVGDKTANQAIFGGSARTFTIGAHRGDFLVIGVAVDNNQTTDGDEGAVSSITDSVGNTYTKAREHTNGQGTAQTGAVCSVWYSPLTHNIHPGYTYTINFTNSTSRDAAGVVLAVFRPSAGSTITVQGTQALATDAADPGAITLGSLTSQEYLWIAALAGEGPSTDAYTNDADYTLLGGANGGTTGGVAATNMHMRLCYRIFTGTTDTVDHTSTTADRDYSQVLVAFRETTGSAPAPGIVFLRSPMESIIVR